MTSSSLHGMGDLVAYLPYQLGYVPRDSLSVVGMRDGTVVLTGRVDRPSSSEAAPLARHIATSFGRNDPDELLVLSYGGYAAADRLFIGELCAQLRGTGIELSHVGQVRHNGSQWRAERCACGGCPRDWTQVPPPDDVGPVAERVLRGVVPAENRADLADRYQLRHPLVAAAIGNRLLDREPMTVHTPDVLPPVLLGADAPVHKLPVDLLAGATLAVDAVQVRDQVLSWLMPEFLPGDLVEVDAPIDPHHLGLPPLWLREVEQFDDPVDRVIDRLEQWVACIPEEWSVPVLLLLAGIRWTTGNGVLASIAVDRALEIESGCRLAVLFEAALRAGLRPTPGEQRPA